MGPLVPRLRGPLAGLGPSLAPEETPCRGIINLSSHKSTLTAKSEFLKSLVLSRDFPLQVSEGHTLLPSSLIHLLGCKWKGRMRQHAHSLGPSVNLEFGPGREQAAGRSTEENDPVQAPACGRE